MSNPFTVDGFDETQEEEGVDDPSEASGHNPFEDSAPAGLPGVDLDLAAVLSIVGSTRSRAHYLEALARGMTAERLEGDGRAIHAFVGLHLKQYGTVPAREQIAAALGLVIPQDPPPGDPAFWVSRVMERDLHRELQGKLSGWATDLEHRNPNKAFEEMRAWVRERDREASPVLIEPFSAHVAEVRARYLRRKAGERGIPTPWPTLNRLTWGIYPEQVWLLVARSGVGKTWLALALAIHAWLSGYRVLVATTEMSLIEIVHRAVAVRLQLPYGKFNEGQLPGDIEARFFAEIDKVFDGGEIVGVGGDFDFSLDAYEAAVDKCRPGEGKRLLVVGDGAYLLQAEGKDRVEKAANTYNRVKKIGKRYGVGQALTTQFNREAKANDAKSQAQEKVAQTDAAVWVSSVVAGLVQTDDMRRDRVAVLKLMKNREGPLGDRITLNFDFDAMDFTEQVPDNDPTKDDFGTGLQAPNVAAGPVEGPGDPFAAYAPSGPSGPLDSDVPF